MSTITFDSTDVASHAVSDGNTLTETSAGVVQKLLWQDIPGASLDATHWTLGGDLFAVAAEAGTITESGNVRSYSNSATGGGNNAKSIKSVLTFSGDGTWQIDVTNWTAAGNRNYLYFYLWVDSTHYVRLVRYKQDATSSITWRCYNGVSKEEPSFNTAATSFSFKIVRSTNDWHGYYNVGAGWVELSTALSHGQNIGTPYLAVQVSANDLGTDPSVSVNDTGIYCTGTGVFWDTDPVVTYTADVSAVGETIDFSATTGTFGVTTLIDVSVDGGATWYATGKTLAEVQALADTTILAGGVAIRTTHGNTTSQSGFTSIEFTASMVASGGHKIMRGVGTGVMTGVC